MYVCVIAIFKATIRGSCPLIELPIVSDMNCRDMCGLNVAAWYLSFYYIIYTMYLLFTILFFHLKYVNLKMMMKCKQIAM